MWKNTIAPREFMNTHKIFPTQQSGVYQLIKYLSENDTVLSITIFGSTVDNSCNPWSGIDVFVETLSGYRSDLARYYEGVENAVDLFCQNDVDDDLLNEIVREGVLVYEKIN